jgi:hypothetical protein
MVAKFFIAGMRERDHADQTTWRPFTTIISSVQLAALTPSVRYYFTSRNGNAI